MLNKQIYVDINMNVDIFTWIVLEIVITMTSKEIKKFNLYGNFNKYQPYRIT